MKVTQRESTPPSGQLLLEALEKRWKKYRLGLKRCRAEFSNEAVHDVRIALRRLLSLTQLLNSISPRPRLRKLDRALKNQLDDFDDLRDTQVILAEVSETINELPQLGKLQVHLERVEKGLLKEIRKKLKKLDLKETTRRVRKTRESLKGEMKADLVAPILMSVDDAFLGTRQRYDRIDPAQPVTIHRVRIAFKTFRYMLEIIHPLLAGFPVDNLERMNDYQSLMGEIQDLEVFTQTIMDYPQNGLSLDLEPVYQYYEARRVEATAAYIKVKDMLDTFWRPSPEGQFPWEKTE